MSEGVSCLEDELEHAPFQSANPIWVLVATFLGTEETAVSLGCIPELKGLTEYMCALDASENARKLLDQQKSYGGPFSDVVCTDNDVLYSFGAKSVDMFDQQERFQAFCREGNVDPFSKPEKTLNRISDGLSGLVVLKADTFYSRDKTVAFSCARDPRKNKRSRSGGYLDVLVLGTRRHVKAQEAWLRTTELGKNFYEPTIISRRKRRRDEA